MSTPIPVSISVTTNPTFGEYFIASLMLIRYRSRLILLHAIFPLAGLFILFSPFITGNSIGLVEILMALLALSYTPILTAYSIWISRRRNKLKQGPFTYSFDSEGMHTSGAAFKQTILWTAIPRVRRSRQFLFVFIAPATAHIIPLREISDPRFFDDLRSIAGGRTDFGQEVANH
jgi:amino acid transporter